MTYKTLVRLFLAVAMSVSIAACESGDQSLPAIDLGLPAGTNSFTTPDASITLSGTAQSTHPIDSVAWTNDRGGDGIAQGKDEWQIDNIQLLMGANNITITATDTVGNSNSRSVVVTRESAAGAGPGIATSGDNSSGYPDPIVMYSYKQGLENSAPVDGATIDKGLVYFYVIPGDEWRQRGIDHMAFYCCDKTGGTQSGADETVRMTVSRDPWSMAINVANFNAGETRSMDVEANLADGSTLDATDFKFKVASSSATKNRPPSIGGTPPTEVAVGSNYDFLPRSSDADSDTMSFTVDKLPGWAAFDPFTGRISGRPSAAHLGLHRNIKITASDGKTSTALSPFTVEVVASNSSPTPPPPPVTPPPPPATPPPPAGSGGTGGTAVAPVIESFTASANAITQGGSVTLRWTVNGADSIAISPKPGVVQGSSVNVFPAATTKYTLTAKNAAGSSNASVSISVLSGPNDWDVKEKPPALNNPKLIDVSKIATSNITANGGILCSGKVYRVNVADNGDAIVYMSGNKALNYPVQVTGGRNVRIVGLHIELVTQPGCGIGELPNLFSPKFPNANLANANIHPRVPSAIALRAEQSNTTYIEGLHIDVRGHEADCIVARNPDPMSNTQAQKQRDVIIQNTYCSGVEGLGHTKIGQGIHGDLFQNQGKDLMRRLVFENVSMRTSQEGIVVHDDNGSLLGTKEMVIRRYDYTWDPRYVGDDNYEMFGLAFAGSPGPNWTLENIRIDDYRDGGDYISISDQRYGDSPNGNVKSHPQIRSGLPPEGAFALPGKTGINYVSPHGGVPSN
jgi:hypothetical protein